MLTKKINLKITSSHVQLIKWGCCFLSSGTSAQIPKKCGEVDETKKSSLKFNRRFADSIERWKSRQENSPF